MDLIRARQLPFLTRRNYYYEILHLLPWSLAVGMVEGNISAVVAARTFGGSELLIGVASTTPVASHLASLLWGMLCVGRRKLRIFTLAASGAVLLLATVGFTPRASWGGWLFVVQMAVAQFFMTGVVTSRSALWKSNYPSEVRGLIISRLQTLRYVVGIVVLLVASQLFDQDPGSYRYVYPISAAFGAMGIVLAQRLRVRGEERELRQLNNVADGPADPGLIEPFSLTALLSPRRVFAGVWEVLRDDVPYRKYLWAQYLAGMANLMVRAVVVAVLANELLTGIAHFYLVSIVLLDALPRALMIATLSRWGRLFDRIGVVRFRVVNALGWTFSLVAGGMATFCVAYAEQIGPLVVPLAIGGFALRAVFQGATFGGGGVAWHIGHLHFAKPERAELYMGIHVSLTGLRGLTMPLLGMLLYSWIGWWVWVVAVALSLLALGGYVSLARDEASRQPAAS